MAITWNEYLKFVLPEVRQAPSNLCIDAIRAAATEFLKITRFYHVTILAQAVLAAASPRNVGITIPGEAKLWTPTWVNWHPASATTGMIELVAKTPQDLDALVPSWRSSQDTAAVPKYYTMRDATNLVLAPWPAANGSVDYDAAFIPTPDSTGCIDDLFYLFYDQIALGAKAKLMLQGGQTWGNPKLGAAYWSQFELEAATAAVREDRGRAPAIITTRTEVR